MESKYLGITFDDQLNVLLQHQGAVEEMPPEDASAEGAELFLHQQAPSDLLPLMHSFELP